MSGKDRVLEEIHVFNVTATSLKINYILLSKPLYFILSMHIALRLEGSRTMDFGPFRESHIKKYARVNFRLLYILLAPSLYWRKKRINWFI